MKKRFLFTLIIFFFFFSSFSNAQHLNGFLSYSTFLSPVDGPYVETYLSIVGNSVNYIKQENGKFQGTIEVTMIFRNNDEIIDFSKYEISSPEVEDTSNINSSFIDQQRFLLPNGEYDFEIIISDKNEEKEPYITTEPVIIDFPADSVSLSDIQLIKSFTKTDKTNILTKSGFDLVPNVYNFYPASINEITFYSEVYNADKLFGENGPYLVSYFVESFNTGSKISFLQKFKRENAMPVNVVFNKFDISRLPSGDYSLVVEVRDRENELHTSKKIFFQRSNPDIKFEVGDISNVIVQNTFAARITNKDTLAEYIRSLNPIASQLDVTFAENLMKDVDLKTMQQYFYNFWSERDEKNPEEAWKKYAIEVRKVNQAFSTQIQKGYETDRGRVYLRYGPPNHIADSHHEPSAYPYEIWHYYTLGTQRNKKFVFATQDIVTNNFILIHSDALGELSNYRWQYELHKRDFEPNNLDVFQSPNQWGSKDKDYFNNPR
ncbi:MAG: GWxTD domain-containing protein [Bacteroidales bacterium]|nr:GWxTD domain-containing protein [Bacteroidales bacterium]